MKMQKCAILIKNNLNINILKIKKYCKVRTVVTIQGDIEVLHIAYLIKNILYLKKLL